ncbi:MAG: universal stress protein [Legionellaceae bacterium]|nr:universal stress protein [Legionellaceae bacterium]
MSNQIIACIDGSISAAAVCDWAVWTAVKRSIPLTLLHTLDNPSKVSHTNLTGAIGLGSREKLLEALSVLDEQRNKIAFQHGKQLLEEAYQRVIAGGIKEARSLQRHGSLMDGLLALEHDIKLIVMGRKGEKTQSRTSQVGGQLETIIRTLHCPILVALPDFKAPRAVMFAFDGSPTAHKALNILVENVHLFEGLTCHLVMVNKNNHNDLFLKAKKRLEGTGIQVMSAQLTGDIEPVLTHYIERHTIDLLIMGAFGHSKIRQFFVGSTTSHMLHTTKIPLLLFK